MVDRPTHDVEPRPPHGICAPDTELDGWSTAHATVRVASVRGYRHRYYGKPRQDCARTAVHPDDGTILFAVADGVSSAERADLGAYHACRSAVRALLALVRSGAELDWSLVLDHVATRLTRVAADLLGGDAPSVEQVEQLLATTLVVGLARPDEGALRVRLARVGDSGAWLLGFTESSCRYQPLFGSKVGAETVVVSNAVNPLPRVPQTLEQVDVSLEPGAVLLVGTDGFGDPLGDGDGQVGVLFGEHLAAPPRQLGFAHLLDFSRETFDDDRTLLAIWPWDVRRRR